MLRSSPRHHFGIRFALLARAWRQSLDAYLSQEGLTDATWVPLVHLQETGGGLSQKDLARLVGVEAPSLVRVIDILVREGLVERRIPPQDLRARLIYLTPAGEARVKAIRATLYQHEAQLLAGLDDATLAQMLGHFEQIKSALEARGQEVVK